VTPAAASHGDAALTLEEFEDHVDEALDSLPDEILDLMDNIEVQVVDRPTREQAASVALDDGELLLGLYVGVPLDRRDTHYGNVLPDRVLIFRRNILRSRRPGRWHPPHSPPRSRTPLRPHRRPPPRPGLLNRAGGLDCRPVAPVAPRHGHPAREHVGWLLRSHAVQSTRVRSTLRQPLALRAGRGAPSIARGGEGRTSATSNLVAPSPRVPLQGRAVNRP